MGKLVRDQIPDLIRADGREPVTRILEDAEYETALHDKLIEESAELREASTKEDVIAEAADVLEVLRAIAGHNGFTLDHVIAAADAKAESRGAFKDRVWLGD